MNPLDELRALSDAATPGPWVAQSNGRHTWIDAAEAGPEPVVALEWDPSPADAAFIVAAVAFVRAFLDGSAA